MLALWHIYLAFIMILFWDTFSSTSDESIKLESIYDIQVASSKLNSTCVASSIDRLSTSFAICFFNGIILNHYEADVVNEPFPTSFSTWAFATNDSAGDVQVFKRGESCEENGNKSNETTVTVNVECCKNHANQNNDIRSLLPSNRRNATWLEPSLLKEPITIKGVVNRPCETQITICTSIMCKQPPTPIATLEDDITTQSASAKNMTRNELLATLPASQYLVLSNQEQLKLRDKAKEIFYHAYFSYMKHAMPKGELRPISCEGGNFDLIKIPMVTLIDTLDTLIIMDDHVEFRRAVAVVLDHTLDFDYDVNVSVFETTIRLLGGLLSAHMMAVDVPLGIYHPNTTKDTYHNELLHLAIDLADRLFPAFQTKTGIPYGTVNLRHGVPKGETKIASTAGAGSLFLEFHVLSILVNNNKYSQAALRAMDALYERRSPFDLVGKHINIETGQWQETMSGVGSNSDSFYEYQLKSYPFLRSFELLKKFRRTYKSIKQHVLPDDTWFAEVDMFSGRLQRYRIENLDAFWPGLEILLGNTKSSSKQLTALYSVWLDLGFLPEELDLPTWRAGKGVTNAFYPLRPELIESTYYQYRATGDRSWLLAGKIFLESIFNYTRTGCGFASIANIATMELADTMPSFFLSETVKYLYLLFDEDNYLHSRPMLLSTEAHPYDLIQLRNIENSFNKSNTFMNTEKEVAEAAPSTPRRRRTKAVDKEKNDDAVNDELDLKAHDSCPHIMHYWDAPSSFMEVNPMGHPLYLENSRLQKNAQVRGGEIKQRRLQRKSTEMLQVLLAKYLQLYDLLLPVDHHLYDTLSALQRRGYYSRNKRPDFQVEKCALQQSEEEQRESATKRGTMDQNKQLNEQLVVLQQAIANTLVPANNVVNSNNVNKNPLKAVELNLGALGIFDVKVYTDSFLIHNRLDQMSLEISNVGQSKLFVRQVDGFSGDTHAAAVVKHGYLTCYVELRRKHQVDVVYRVPCSTATFGKPPPFTIEAELIIPSYLDENMCGPLGASKHPNVIKRKQSQASSSIDDALGMLNNRLRKSFLGRRLIGGQDEDEEDKAIDGDEVEGKIAMTFRGVCLFEDKANVAMVEGASALIIRNRENILFTMAGKRDIEAEIQFQQQQQEGHVQDESSFEDAQAHAASNDLTIPVVMITNDHAEQLLHLMQTNSNRNRNNKVSQSPLLVRIVVEQAPSIAISTFMGNALYPKIWQAKGVIFVQTQGRWGAFFRKNAGDEWQMYLMDLRDIHAQKLMPPITILTADKKNKLSTTPALMMSTGLQYKHFLRRQCPSYMIRVEDSQGMVYKQRKEMPEDEIEKLYKRQQQVVE